MNNEVLILPSNFGLDDDDFRAVVYDDGSMTLFDGPGVVEDENTVFFRVSAENMKPFVEWLNKRMEAEK
jgi:hypothetical protein